jgi:single-stranded DNA-binding protein
MEGGQAIGGGLGRQAEIACEYAKKGRPIFIEGRLQLDSWDDKQSGQKRYKLRVVGENIQLLGGRPFRFAADTLPSRQFQDTLRTSEKN